MTSKACNCGERSNVHETGEGGCENGVYYFHGFSECRVVDDRTLRCKVFGAIGRWFIRAAGPASLPGPGPR